MSPLLFALVDAVLQQALIEAGQPVPADAPNYVFVNRVMYANQMRHHLGWWRSLWGVL